MQKTSNGFWNYWKEKDMLIDQKLTEYLENEKRPEPLPGGGSVSAYVGALGAALNIMVYELSVGKKSYEALPEETREEIVEGVDSLNKIIEDLKPLVDEDSKSFDAVLDAYKLPKETEEEKAARSEAIQKGFIHALKVPLRIAELCVEALDLVETFAKNGNIHAITDVGCGVLMLATGAEGALFNVYINLKSIKDEQARAEYNKEADALLKTARELRDGYLHIVYERLENE
jgi:formiminotetrahydrofolate cyclodeaminase